MAYARIQDRLWHGLRPLGDDARLLALYVRTSSHRNRVGLYRLEPLYVAADLAWDEPRVLAALEGLTGAVGVAWDADARVILVTDVLPEDPPANLNVAKAAIREIESVPDTPLFARLLECATEAKEMARLAGKETKHFDPLLDAIARRAGVARTVTETVPKVPEQPLSEEQNNRAANHSGNGSANGRSPSLSQASTKPVPIQAKPGAGREQERREDGSARAWEILKPIIREQWHGGADTVVVGGKEIGMGAEKLNVDELVSDYGADVVIGVVSMGPGVLDGIEMPTTLRVFTSDKVGPANWSLAVGQWHKRDAAPAAAPRASLARRTFPEPERSTVAAGGSR